MSKLQDAHSLITYYKKKYEDKFGYSPGLPNRNKVKYLIGDALEDLTVNQFKKLIDYYLRTEAEPSLTKLCYEYDEVHQRMNSDAKDLDQRRILLSETERRVREFREKFGKHD